MARRNNNDYTRNAPDWALSLVADVTCSEGVALTNLHWSTHDRPSSSGACRGGLEVTATIWIEAGTDEWDQKLVLLHELAHAISPRSDHHSAKMWDHAFRLFRENGLDMERAYRRERHYKRAAIYAAERAGVAGASEDLRTIRINKQARRAISAETAVANAELIKASEFRPIRRPDRYEHEPMNGRTLYAVHGGKVYTARVDADRYETRPWVGITHGTTGERRWFGSMSAAAQAITGRASTNGWDFWMLDPAEDGEEAADYWSDGRFN